MYTITFITGGARSGKSTRAEALASRYEDVLYIATAQLWDDEMRERARRHQRTRPAHWRTVECSGDVAAEVAAAGVPAVLIDCVTLWITALMTPMARDWDNPTQAEIDAAEAVVHARVDDLIAAAKASIAHTIIVSNELGMGLVPLYPFGRAFRDVAGRANQRLADAADDAIFMVSGLPLYIKKHRIGANTDT